MDPLTVVLSKVSSDLSSRTYITKGVMLEGMLHKISISLKLNGILL